MITEEFVRRRPALFIGNHGVLDLMRGLLLECIAICETDDLFFTITLTGKNDFSLEIKSLQSLSLLAAQFTKEPQERKYLMPFVLSVFAASFDKKMMGEQAVSMRFSLDEPAFGKVTVDYLNLIERCLDIAVLNRKVKLLLVNEQTEPHSKQYLHFPQGIFYLFSRLKENTIGALRFELEFDGLVKNNHFQIAMGFGAKWFPQPFIHSFANDIRTVEHGSLVEGILNGLMRASKKYAALHSIPDLSFRSRKLCTGMLLVAAVRGKEFTYGGSFKETLEDDEVKKQADDITYEFALAFWENHPSEAYSFFNRFRKYPWTFVGD